MTNEELAARIRAGEEELMPELWEQTKRYLFKLCTGRYRGNFHRCASAGVTLDDIKQLAYLAFWSAVKAYDPEKEYPFLSYAAVYLRNEVNSALGLHRREDPLNICTSLDAPIDGEDGLTIGDMVADQNAEDHMTDIEDQFFLQQLHNELEGCLDALPEREAETIREKYYNGREIDHNGEVRALRKLRKPEIRRRLSGYAAELFSAQCYHWTGFRTWKNDGISSPERMTEKTERTEDNGRQ